MREDERRVLDAYRRLDCAEMASILCEMICRKTGQQMDQRYVGMTKRNGVFYTSDGEPMLLKRRQPDA